MPAKKRAVIMAFSCKQQYHIMRAAVSAGYEIYVLGQHCARGLQESRYCKGYHELKADLLQWPKDELIAEIQAYAKEIGADTILPADVLSTRILIAIGDQLGLTSCALPTPESFDMLDDKWRFFEFCTQHTIPTPKSWLMESIDELKDAVKAGRLSLSLIIKPHNSMGGLGIHQVHSMQELQILGRKINYSPLLVQELIIGKEVDISILADHGEIIAYAIQRQHNDHFAFVQEDVLLDMARILVRKSNYHGIAHIDAIKDTITGQISLIECNPRVWYSMFAATIAGINFLGHSMEPAILRGQPALRLQDVRVPYGGIKALLLNGLRRGRLTPVERKILHYNLSDYAGRRRCLSERYDDTRLAMDQPGSPDYRLSAMERIRAV